MILVRHRQGPKYKGKQYYRFDVENIPKKAIEKAGFKNKDKLKAYVKEGKIIIEKI